MALVNWIDLCPPTGFQFFSSQQFASVRPVFKLASYRSPEFAEVRRSSLRLPSR